jgi:hypothetical protein
MSATEKAFGVIKALLTYQERLDGLDAKLTGLGAGLARLADSHVALRERVSRIEGLIEGAAMARRTPDSPRIEG